MGREQREAQEILNDAFGKKSLSGEEFLALLDRSDIQGAAEKAPPTALFVALLRSDVFDEKDSGQDGEAIRVFRDLLAHEMVKEQARKAPGMLFYFCFSQGVIRDMSRADCVAAIPVALDSDIVREIGRQDTDLLIRSVFDTMDSLFIPHGEKKELFRSILANDTMRTAAESKPSAFLKYVQRSIRLSVKKDDAFDEEYRPFLEVARDSDVVQNALRHVEDTTGALSRLFRPAAEGVTGASEEKPSAEGPSGAAPTVELR